MTSAEAARNYPTGCGLFVIVYKRSHYIYNSSLTQCNFLVTEIGMYGTIVREHWFGVEELREYEDEDTYTDHLVLRLRADCANSGSYFYQIATSGWLEWNGTEYEAGAYDRTESSVNC
jgi:hypothetical protein